jgi:integrase
LSVEEEEARMARTIKPAAISTRTSRARLRRGRQPHLNPLTARAALGYVRREGERVGRWILRRRIGGKYSTLTIGVADDAIESDGVGTLTFHEARERALELSNSERVAGSPSVARVFEDYVQDLQARGRSTEVARTASIYIAELADVPVAELTTRQLTAWLATVAAVSVRHGKPVVGDEAARKRRNSANRIAGVLVAALNLAFREGRAPSDAAWRRLRRFEGVDAARTRFLSVDECTRLLNASPEDFRALAKAALVTGCRFGELARLEVGDLDLDAATIHVRRSKSGRARHVPLNAEALAFFRSLAIGRSGDELMLRRADGEPWRHAIQSWPMAAACERARIEPRVSFHALRHTYASLAVMNGAPLPVIAAALGHTTTRMSERYAHLARSYVGDAIRAAAPVFGADVSAGNVESLDRAKARVNR